MTDDHDEDQDNVADLTVEILKQIRDEVRNTNVRLDATNERLDRHEEVLIKLLQGQERHERLLAHHGQLLERHERVLERHEQALSQLVVEVQNLNGRFDNFLTGAHQKAHQDISDELATLKQRVDRIEEREQAR